MLGHPLAPGAELRPLEPWQAAEFAGYVEQHRAHLAPWLPWAVSITDTESARRFLQRYADSQAADGGRIFGIRLDGVLVGGVLFRVFDPRAGVCEIGVWLAPQAQGRGLVTLAARHLIDWALGVRGLTRVEWRTVPDNNRSIAAARRLGMTREGVLRQAFPHNGVRHDVEIWALTAA
ncbi:GNAT family N-acetyltransferase [Micromonospora sp. NBC_01796]|uniref:GNAT family N-acetyltransferase n=1 Tax=Micromonospora sp. NBC_01796 TaxID=2975987 RepID=UPI002DDC8975|nr:GNAT family protein [Micromonospora sp. NBC_01796]WSA82973.1 GNAT family N-acetyltransferase [Micromonospora sp. NBC_01796]